MVILAVLWISISLAIKAHLEAVLPWSLCTVGGYEQPTAPQRIVSTMRDVVQNLVGHLVASRQSSLRCVIYTRKRRLSGSCWGRKERILFWMLRSNSLLSIDGGVGRFWRPNQVGLRCPEPTEDTPEGHVSSRGSYSCCLYQTSLPKISPVTQL